jgi:hypothetical protein
LEKYDVAELLQLRAEIDAALPARNLADLDLETEIVVQYQQTKALQAAVINDSGVPANQRAQDANSCAAVLEKLMKMRTELHTAERIKTIEQILIRALKLLPQEAALQFLDEYERMLNKTP